MDCRLPRSSRARFESLLMRRYLICKLKRHYEWENCSHPCGHTISDRTSFRAKSRNVVATLSGSSAGSFDSARSAQNDATTRSSFLHDLGELYHGGSSAVSHPTFPCDRL